MEQNLDIEVVPEQRLITLTLSGPLTLKFLWHVMTTVASTPGADPTYRLLFDGSALTLDEANARELSSFEAKVPTERDRLAIVGSDDLHFGFARMYEAWSQPTAGREVRVFRSRDEAHAWLLEP